MKVSVVGRGNVASHLKKALQDKIDISIIDPHTLHDLDVKSDIILISVSDSAVKDVANSIKEKLDSKTDLVVAHTSGTVPLSILNGLPCRTGVLYPMQTFSKEVILDYNEIPIFIEGSDNIATIRLRDLAYIITSKVHDADSEVRKALHIAAVLSCNFTNHLWTLADSFLQQHGLDFSMMHPLIKETLRKACEYPPASVQTGPAIRKDYNVMNAHLKQLSEDNNNIAEIYKLMSDSIINFKE